MQIVGALQNLCRKLCGYIFTRLSDFFMEKQPTDSTCGQTCVAFIVGISVDEVIEVVGKKGGTYGRDLRKALRKFNVPHTDRMIRITKTTQKPDYCIIRIVSTVEKEAHWVIFRKGRYYDPADGSISSEQKFWNGYAQWRETSYLEILEAF